MSKRRPGRGRRTACYRSFYLSHIGSLRQLVERLQLTEIDRLCAGWNVDRVGNGRDVRSAFEIADFERVLRRLDDVLAGDDVTAGYRLRAALYPDLPIDLRRPEGQIFAFDPIHESAGNMLGLRHI